MEILLGTILSFQLISLNMGEKYFNGQDIFIPITRGLAAQDFPGRPGNVLSSRKVQNYFSQPAVDKFMQTADCFSHSEPVFCGISIWNKMCIQITKEITLYWTYFSPIQYRTILKKKRICSQMEQILFFKE